MSEIKFSGERLIIHTLKQGSIVAVILQAYETCKDLMERGGFDPKERLTLMLNHKLMAQLDLELWRCPEVLAEHPIFQDSPILFHATPKQEDELPHCSQLMLATERDRKIRYVI